MVIDPVMVCKGIDTIIVPEALDGLPVYKLHCSILAEEAIQAALKDYEERKKKQNAADKPDSE